MVEELTVSIDEFRCRAIVDCVARRAHGHRAVPCVIAINAPLQNLAEPLRLVERNIPPDTRCLQVAPWRPVANQHWKPDGQGLAYRVSEVFSKRGKKKEFVPQKRPGNAFVLCRPAISHSNIHWESGKSALALFPVLCILNRAIDIERHVALNAVERLQGGLQVFHRRYSRYKHHRKPAWRFDVPRPTSIPQSRGDI